MSKTGRYSAVHVRANPPGRAKLSSKLAGQRGPVRTTPAAIYLQQRVKVRTWHVPPPPPPCHPIKKILESPLESITVTQTEYYWSKQPFIIKPWCFTSVCILSLCFSCTDSDSVSGLSGRSSGVWAELCSTQTLRQRGRTQHGLPAGSTVLPGGEAIQLFCCFNILSY